MNRHAPRPTLFIAALVPLLLITCRGPSNHADHPAGTEALADGERDDASSTDVQAGQEGEKGHATTVESAPPRARGVVELPAEWETVSRERFAADMEAWPPAGTRVALQEEELVALRRALGAADESSVRAAVVLGRSDDPRADEILLTRLETRVVPREGSSAGDVVAAAALAEGALMRETGARLEVLASGPEPHPVLEVRLECATASLRMGRDGAVQFLLGLLREGTPQAMPRPDWTRLDPDDARLRRMQDRAARALSQRVGIECTFRAHASVAARESEIARLSNLLLNIVAR